jgi:LPXTG-site transpeptidase (sortase) family protein
VFAALPRIPELLDEGEDVFIVLAAIGREYLYQVSRTEVVHQDNLQITESEDARITLVTCYPRFKYDHRLVVTAHLVGFREPPAGP